MSKFSLMDNGNNNLIILGDVGSGKTAYIASAMYSLLQPDDIPYLSIKKEYTFVPEIESGFNQLMNHITKLVDEGVFPAFTRPTVVNTSELEKSLLKVRLFINYLGKPVGQVNIECYDFPGEQFRRFTRRHVLSTLGLQSLSKRGKSLSEVEEYYENILRKHLDQATGCVILVNPIDDPLKAVEQDNLLSSLLYRLLNRPRGLFRSKKPRLRRISLVVSKADIVEERGRLTAMEYLMRYLPLTTRFAVNFLPKGNVKAFWASSVGKVIDRIIIQDEVTGEETYKYIPMNPIRPFGVVESLLWAMNLESTLEDTSAKT